MTFFSKNVSFITFLEKIERLFLSKINLKRDVHTLKYLYT